MIQRIIVFIILSLTFCGSYAQKVIPIAGNVHYQFVNEHDLPVNLAAGKGDIILIKTYKNCASCFTQLDDFIAAHISKQYLEHYMMLTLVPKRSDPIWYLNENKRLIKYPSFNYFMHYGGELDTVHLMPSLPISNLDISPIVLLCDGQSFICFSYGDLYDKNEQVSQKFEGVLKENFKK